MQEEKKHVCEYELYTHLNKLMSVTPHSSQNECYFLTMYTIVDMSLTVFFSSSYDRCISHENKTRTKFEDLHLFVYC